MSSPKDYAKPGVSHTKVSSRRPKHPLRSLENSLGLKAAGKEVIHRSPKLPRTPKSPKTPTAAPSPGPKMNIMPPYTGSNTDKARTDGQRGELRIRTEPFHEHYSQEREIGRGKFAVVRRCKSHHSGREFAAKFQRKRRKGKDCRKDILHEVTMLQMALRHTRLVDLVEVFETSHEIIIVTEYASGGELFHHIEMEDRFHERDVVRLMRQILEGLIFLHAQSIVHCDVKPQNILLTEPLPRGHIKLCDLGFARKVNSGEDVRDLIGTPDYVAPEVLQYEPIHTSCDMWSVGVLTYVMLTGCSPFGGDTVQETYLNISQVNLDFPDDIFSDITPLALDFMSQLMVREPGDRLTAEESLEHPWLQCEEPLVPRSPAACAVTPVGSPAGCRRALTPPSPDCTNPEPTKKCKCDSANSANHTHTNGTTDKHLNGVSGKMDSAEANKKGNVQECIVQNGIHCEDSPDPASEKENDSSLCNHGNSVVGSHRNKDSEVVNGNHMVTNDNVVVLKEVHDACNAIEHLSKVDNAESTQDQSPKLSSRKLDQLPGQREVSAEQQLVY